MELKCKEFVTSLVDPRSLINKTRRTVSETSSVGRNLSKRASLNRKTSFDTALSDFNDCEKANWQIGEQRFE